MRRYCFYIGLAIIFFTNILFVSANAQTPSKEIKNEFKAVSVAHGDKASLTFYATLEGKTVEEQTMRFKSVEEAKKRIEQLLSESKEILEARTFFRKAENETLARYLLSFEDGKNKTTYYKIATLSNDLVAFTTASTKELLLEFENWKITQK